MTAGDRLHWRLSPATRFNNSSSSNQLASPSSCGLVQTEDVSVHVGGEPFVGDYTVDGDAATDGGSVALRAQVGEERRVSGGQGARPRQWHIVDALGLGVFVEVVDGGHGGLDTMLLDPKMPCSR